MSETPTDGTDERFVTQEELQRWLRFTDNNDQAWSDELSEVLDAAIALVEDRVGPLAPSEAVYRVYSSGTALLLPAAGFASVAAVTAPDGTVLDLDRLDVDADAGIVHVPYPRSGAWQVTATRSAPRDLAPLRLAVKIIAAHNWKLSQGGSNAGVSRFAEMAGEEYSARRTGFAVPRRAAELMAPFEQTAGFA